MKIDFNNPKVQLFIALLVIGSIVAISVAVVNSSNHTTIEQYIKEAQSALVSLTASNVSFEKYAKDYVEKRTGSESSVSNLVTNSNSALSTILNLRNNCQDRSTSINQSLQALISVNNTSSGIAQSSITAVQNIIAIVEETKSATNDNSSEIFGSNLENITTNKTNAETNYASITGFIGIVEKNYTDATNNQQSIAGNLSTAYSALYDLQSFVKDLVNNVKNSTEYINLQNAQTKAENMISQLVIIERNMSTKSGNQYSQIISLLDSLRIATSSATRYLKNVVDVFSLAIKDSDSTLSGYITTILNNFSKSVALIGKVTASNSITPTPFTTPFAVPTLSPTEGLTIIFLWNKAHEDYKNLVVQYNTFIGYFNSVTESLNSLTEYGGNTIIRGVNTNINSLNTSLLNAQKEMASYFPGGTTPGIIPYTVPIDIDRRITSLPTVAPYTYTAI